MKFVVLIPKEEKKDGNGNFLKPSIAIVNSEYRRPGDYISMCRTEPGGLHDYCVDDFDIYAWDLERISQDILYALFRSPGLKS